MQVQVEVTAEIRSEAEARGIPIVDYVELLVAKGREALLGTANVTGALERIRALRTPEPVSRR